MKNTILLLFRRYYFHTRISIMKRELLFLHLISVCQISQNATTKFNSNGRKLWTRFVKFDTFVYSHYKPRYKCSIICSDWKQSFRFCDNWWYITLEFRCKLKENRWIVIKSSTLRKLFLNKNIKMRFSNQSYLTISILSVPLFLFDISRSDLSWKQNISWP